MNRPSRFRRYLIGAALVMPFLLGWKPCAATCCAPVKIHESSWPHVDCQVRAFPLTTLATDPSGGVYIAVNGVLPTPCGIVLRISHDDGNSWTWHAFDAPPHRPGASSLRGDERRR